MSGIIGRVIKRAKHTQVSLGTRCAAGYMRNQGMSLELALLVLTGRMVD